MTTEDKKIKAKVTFQDATMTWIFQANNTTIRVEWQYEKTVKLGGVHHGLNADLYKIRLFSNHGEFASYSSSQQPNKTNSLSLLNDALRIRLPDANILK